MSTRINPLTGMAYPGQRASGVAGVVALGAAALCATSGGAVTVATPLLPSEGSSFAVSDADGNAAANPITLNGSAGALIDGAATLALNTANVFASFVFASGQWRRVMDQVSVVGKVVEQTADVPQASAGALPAGALGELQTNGSPTAFAAASNVVGGSGFLGWNAGGTLPSTGAIRQAFSAVPLITIKDSGAVDRNLLWRVSGDTWRFGDQGVGTRQVYADTIVEFASTEWKLFCPNGSTIALDLTSNTVLAVGVALGFGGGVQPTSGILRFPTAPGVVIGCRDVANANDLAVLALATNDILYVGTDALLTPSKQVELTNVFAGNNVQLGVGGNVVLQVNPASVLAAQPLLGLNTAWGGINGEVDIALAGTGNYTPSAAEYSNRCLKFTGARTAIGNINIPAPTNAQGYLLVAQNSTTGGFVLTLTTGAGTTQALGAGGTKHLFWVSASGVDLIA